MLWELSADVLEGEDVVVDLREMLGGQLGGELSVSSKTGSEAQTLLAEFGVESLRSDENVFFELLYQNNNSFLSSIPSSSSFHVTAVDNNIVHLTAQHLIVANTTVLLSLSSPSIILAACGLPTGFDGLSFPAGFYLHGR